MDKLHSFAGAAARIPLPDKFTYPFHYTPHPLCVMAAGEVQRYLMSVDVWQEELRKGKMFGVLVVRTSRGEVGFLAAFSGILAGKNQHAYFVPPVYDVQEPGGFFEVEEEQISAINERIRQLEEDALYAEYRQRLSAETLLARLEQDEMKNQMKEAKEQRERLRQEHPDDATLEILTRESQFQKAELKRLKQHWNTRLLSLQAEIEAFETEIERLRTERKTRSAALQQRLFKQFQMLDACGRKRDLCDIFQDTAQKVPPAGAGECAAPKLLQYAYRNSLQPVAMAEFWWGDSPKNEIRRHGYYYPACKGKCEPILRHMLQGLQVEDNPLQNDSHRDTELEILYEDEWLLVVNKPAGMLSVPGKLDVDSVYQRVRRIYPEATGPMIVHRLDMATSGLLLIAKTKEVHQNLQAQFKNRTVRKRYVALLDGLVKRREGLIALPLRPDPEDRPRQVVDEVSGKPAVTLFETLICEAHRSRVLFFPQTGRTHQLRVHAAHPLGLDAPIVGDELYGKKAERLYLHAEYLAFRHPVSGRMIEVEKLAEF
ncbi:RNA pseudouridine synthase [Parabacteroides acidifaciens]|uniref:RNA pseudouridine synthase n=1 Tax=Parabacteroides acidifaciens TaxID=2290935 RepID=A0A3D8HE17_9BACT|nr:pseudouridine synthase [Parabacteroides acidifaciens]MBC8602116.1 RNA pseudouridine synthase [Parabacteroides acidifaciens]RDU49215.1 RNA pseudouridine synthase [Parabacteroides acidifaciens]